VVLISAMYSRAVIAMRRLCRFLLPAAYSLCLLVHVVCHNRDPVVQEEPATPISKSEPNLKLLANTSKGGVVPAVIIEEDEILVSFSVA